jgi:hypothetical protein
MMLTILPSRRSWMYVLMVDGRKGEGCFFRRGTKSNRATTSPITYGRVCAPLTTTAGARAQISLDNTFHLTFVSSHSCVPNGKITSNRTTKMSLRLSSHPASVMPINTLTYGQRFTTFGFKKVTLFSPFDFVVPICREPYCQVLASTNDEQSDNLT